MLSLLRCFFIVVSGFIFTSTSPAFVQFSEKYESNLVPERPLGEVRHSSYLGSFTRRESRTF